MAGVKVIKGDMVQVLSGKDKGKQGKVVRVWPGEDRVLVEGVNQVKRHERVRAVGGRGGMQGGILTKDMPVRLSTVAVVCPSCGRPTRVGYDVGPEGKRRMCRRCGGAL